MTRADRSSEKLPEISATELNERLGRGDELALVDVREPYEREIADLPEVRQLRIPIDQLLGRVSELDREAPLILYCRSGSRSGWATQELLALGFDNVWNGENYKSLREKMKRRQSPYKSCITCEGRSLGKVADLARNTPGFLKKAD